MFPNFIETFKNLFRHQESGFKVVGNYWFARYSNAFEDREGEYFPRKAIDQFVERVDTGVVPAPELWIWHEPIVVGKALTVARIDNFAVAVGYFHESPLGQAAKQFLSTHKAKLSHGFMFNPEAFKENAYHDYNTFEISVLPFNKNVEANAYTNIEVKEKMTITPEKESFFKELFGEETAKELIETTSKASKALEETGARFKDFTHIDALRIGAKADGDDEDMDDEDDKMDDDDMDKKAMPMLIADLYRDFGELAESQNIVAKALKEIKDMAIEMKKSFDDQNKASKALVETLKAENKALRDELGLTPQRASQSLDTVTDDKDLQKALEDKSTSDIDPFYAPFLDKR